LELLVIHIEDRLAKLLADDLVLFVLGCHIESASMCLVYMIQSLLKTSLNLASVSLDKSLSSQF
jgi:hypothetical protein